MRLPQRVAESTERGGRRAASKEARGAPPCNKRRECRRKRKLSRTTESGAGKPDPEGQVNRPKGHTRRAEAGAEFGPRSPRDIEPVREAVEKEELRIDRDAKRRKDMSKRNAAQTKKEEVDPYG